MNLVINRVGRIAAAIILCRLLAGCASPDAGRFATAAERVVRDATAAYEQLDQAVSARRLAEIAANPPELPDHETFAPLLPSRDLSARMALLGTLGTYAKGLRELDTAKHRDRIDRATRNLESSLLGLDRGLREADILDSGVTPADLAVLASTVRRLGAGISEARRRQAIHAAVKMADPAVRQAATLLADELPRFGDFVEANLATVETELLAAYRSEAEQLNFPTRIARLEEIRQHHIMRCDAKAFFATVARAAGRLGEAHAAQKKAFDLNDINLATLAQAMAELEQAESEIRAFQQRWLAWREKRP